MQDSDWLGRLSAPFPAYFAFVMATGILAVGARWLGHPMLARALFGINCAAYVMLWCCGAIRLAHAPRRVWRELRGHETGPPFLTIVAASAVLGSDLAMFHTGQRVVLALFAIAILSWIVLIYSFLATITEGRQKPPLEHGLTGSWLLMIVSTASLAVLGSSVLQQVGAPRGLVFCCYFWLGVSWFYYTVLSALVFLRFAFVPMSPDEITGPWWINESAAAITVLAGCKLIQIPGLAIGPFPLRQMLPPMVGIFWAEATFWIPLLVLLFGWKYLVRARPFRYTRGLWSVVFPIGMYAAATLQFRTTFDLPFLLPAAQLLFWIGLVVWGVSMVGMLRHAARSLRGG